MNDRCARARALIVEALQALDAELAAPSHPIPPEQLRECGATLRGYLEALEAGALPPKRERPEGLGRLVVDCWPFGNPVAEAVLRAERAWRNC